MFYSLVLKPELARQVESGPGRPGFRTGLRLSKNLPESWPGETQSTQVNPAEIRLPS